MSSLLSQPLLHEPNKNSAVYHVKRKPSIWQRITNLRNDFKRKYAYSADTREISISKSLSLQYYESSQHETKLRRLNLILTIFSMLGLLLMIVSLVLNWDNSNKTFIYLNSNYYSATVILYDCCKFANVFCTLICIFLLIEYYRQLSIPKMLQWRFTSPLAAFLNSTLKYRFLAEFVVLIITPLPFVERSETMLRFLHYFETYNLMLSFDYIGLLMFARYYLIIRIIRDYNYIYQKRREIVSSISGIEDSTKFGYELALRLLFYNYTIISVFSVFIITALTASFCLYVFERSIVGGGLDDFSHCLYLMFITMWTVGFGDFAAKTYLGRIVSIFQGFTGTLFSAVFTGIVINKLVPNDQQKYTQILDERERLLLKKLECAVTILQVHWLYKRKKCGVGYKVFTAKAKHLRMRKLDKKLDDLEATISKKSKHQEVYALNKALRKKVSILKDIIHRNADIINKIVIANTGSAQTL